MIVTDIIKMTEKINLYSTITSNYVSEDEDIEKPVIVIKGVSNTDVELERGKATDDVIYALYNELIDLRKKYEYIKRVMKEEFKFEIEDLVEKYSTEEYLAKFKDGLNLSREKENGASLTFIISEDDDENPDTTMCTIKLKDIFEKNNTYLTIEDIISDYKKKVVSPHYIQATTWLRDHDLETLEVPQDISDDIDALVKKAKSSSDEEVDTVEGESVEEEEEVRVLKRNPDGTFS